MSTVKTIWDIGNGNKFKLGQKLTVIYKTKLTRYSTFGNDEDNSMVFILLINAINLIVIYKETRNVTQLSPKKTYSQLKHKYTKVKKKIQTNLNEVSDLKQQLSFNKQ